MTREELTVLAKEHFGEQVGPAGEIRVDELSMYQLLDFILALEGVLETVIPTTELRYRHFTGLDGLYGLVKNIMKPVSS